MDHNSYTSVNELSEEVQLYEGAENFTKKAFENLYELRKNCKLCDIVLISCGKRISAQKVVLAASIPYFQLMFTSDMLESNASEVEINEVEPEAIIQMVNYAYNQRVKITLQNVQSVMTASNYLQVTDVTEACCSFLLKHLRPQNVLGILGFCQDMSAEDTFVNDINDYISKHFLAVSKEEEFLSLPVDVFLSLLKQDDLYVEDETDIFHAAIRWLQYEPGRREFAARALSCVRLPLLRPEFLADVVATHEIVRSDLECRDLVDEAKDYHLLQDRRGSMRSFKCIPRHCDGIPGIIFAIGGMLKPTAARSTMELYDPLTKEWSASSNMLTLRSRIGVAAAGRKVYAIGGFNGQDRLRTVEVFDYDKNSWSPIANMGQKRSALAATFYGNQLYVCGGYEGIQSLSSVEIYNPIRDTWSDGPQMLKQRSAAGIAVLGDYIYVLGGHDGITIFKNVERYDTVGQKWESIPSMAMKRCRLGAATYHGKVYACGGYDGANFLQSVERFDPKTLTWEPVSPMRVKRSRVAVVANSDGLYAIAGFDGEVNLCSCERYDERTDQWEFVASLKTHEGNVGVGIVPIPPELL